MRILITGVPGWLGNRFLELLLTGFETPIAIPAWDIRCLVLDGSDLTVVRKLSAYKNIEIVPGDVTKREDVRRAVKDVDIVFHAAGLIHPRKISDVYTVNKLGTFTMISEACTAGAAKFVYISSNSACGVNRNPPGLMRETDVPRPYMNYGLSKYQAENIVRNFQETGKIQTVILRPCWFYGPNQPRRQSRFFKMIEKGDPILFGNGRNLRSMSYVDNVSLAMALAAVKDEAAGQTYWVADARAYTTLEIYRTVADLLEVKNFRPRFVPGIVSEACFFADSVLQSFGLYQTEIHVAGEMNKNIACSIEKARKELGYAPAVELREGMRRSIEWCRKNNLL
jgi:nucleoside-diphosphate-sugar epimerase